MTLPLTQEMLDWLWQQYQAAQARQEQEIFGDAHEHEPPEKEA